MLNGIDVASYQMNLINKNPKWVTHYYDFVMIKSTEGKTYHNPDADKLVKMCKENNRLYGLYHYARAEVNTPREEAQYFLAHNNGYKDAMFALDVEQLSLTNPDIDAWSREWLDIVYKASGKRPLLYISQGITNMFQKVCAGNYGLWVAQWGSAKVGNIAPWSFWAIWQYHVNREHNIDMNFFNGTDELFRKYCGN